MNNIPKEYPNSPNKPEWCSHKGYDCFHCPHRNYDIGKCDCEPDGRASRLNWESVFNKATAVVCFLLLSASLAFAWEGSGTYEDPYQIGSSADWIDINNNSSFYNFYEGIYFIQTADIDLGEQPPVGLYAEEPFKGNYDGNGYVLSNLYQSAVLTGATYTNAFGAFGYTDGATIENVSLYGNISVDCYITPDCLGVGGIVGIAMGDCHFAGLKSYVDISVNLAQTTTGVSSAGNIRYGIGGVVGLIGWTPNAGTTFYGCENYGNIYVDGANGETCVGGCFTANVPNSGTDTTFSGWNNYGKIVVNGTDEATMYVSSLASGVGAIHWSDGSGSTSRTPKFVGCSNFGNIICSNSVHSAGVCINGRGNQTHCISASYCTNYGEIAFVDDNSATRIFLGGVASGVPISIDNVVRYCVNFGKIKASGGVSSAYPQIGGVYSSHNGEYASSGYSYGNKNFGDIEADCPNASSVIASGVGATFRKGVSRQNENYGNISVNTSGSVLIGGVLSQSSQGMGATIYSDCVNFGNITATGNSNTNYSPCVGGVFASTRSTGVNTRNIVVSNCYNLGQAKLNLNSPDCYGAIYGVANTYGNYIVSVKNCYAILGEGQNLIGAVDASNGNVSLENCVGIKNGREGGIAYSVVGSNNWSQSGTQIVSYEDCYTYPNLCLGNISSGLFFPADKTTNFFDLILPINTKLYLTPSATDKKNHSYTKAQGYKRYVKTNRK